MALSDAHVGRVTRFVSGRPFVRCTTLVGNDREAGPLELLTSVPPLAEGDRVLLIRALDGSIVVVGKLT